MQHIISFLKAHKLFGILAVIIIVGGSYYFTRPAPLPTYETTQVKKGSVVQEVSVTGKVEADHEIDLSFERSGKVLTEPRQVGDHVKAGDVLVRLDTSELSALRLGAKANIDLEEANLAAIEKGSRPEDIAISEAQVQSARSAYNDALVALSDKTTSAFTPASDALYNKTDHFFSNPRTTYPQVTFPVTDSKLQLQLEQSRIALEAMFSAWTGENSDTDLLRDPLKRGGMVEAHLKQLRTYLDMLAEAINSITLSNSSISQTTIDSWKLDVSTARTNVNAAITSVVGAEQAANSSESAVSIAENQLALKQAGPTAEVLAGEAAKIASLRATLANYDAQIAKMSLVAPFDGVVTRQDAKLGQTVTLGVPIVSLMSDKRFKITANVTEADIAKVHVGNEAKMTFDAYGSDVFFMGKVTMIDPAETVIEGVSTYKVTLYLDKDDERVRSGMTANIDISTDKRENVLAVPSRAITTENDKKYVKVVVSDGTGTTTMREVVTGLRGSDGNTEIVSGLSEGDIVVTFGL